MEIEEEKIELFEKTKVSKAVAKLAIPTMLASIVMILYSLADTFFVGRPFRRSYFNKCCYACCTSNFAF